MPTYETLFIVPPNIAEEDERTIVDTVAGIIQDGGGNIIAKDLWGRRRLAYPIAKHEDGNYVRFLYEAATAVPAEIERRNRLSDKVLRSLTIKLEKADEERAREQAVLDAQRREEERKAAEERAAREAAGESVDGDASASSDESGPADSDSDDDGDDADSAKSDS